MFQYIIQHFTYKAHHFELFLAQFCDVCVYTGAGTATTPVKMMNFVLMKMSFIFKMMNFVFKMMNLQMLSSSPSHGE